MASGWSDFAFAAVMSARFLAPGAGDGGTDGDKPKVLAGVVGFCVMGSRSLSQKAPIFQQRQ